MAFSQWDENSPYPKPADGICISNINPLTTLSQIEAAVSKVAKIKNIEMKLDPRTGMQMGICYVTFSPTEERIPGDGKKKKPTVIEIPGWRHARAAQMKLNGQPIGVNVGAQKESLMKVVLDPNGDRTRRVMEMELEKRKKALSTPTVVPPVNATPGSANAEVPSSRAAQAPPPTVPSTLASCATASAPIPPPATSSFRPLPPHSDAFPKPYMPNSGSYPGRPSTFDSRLPSRANDRPSGASFAHDQPGQGPGSSRGYRDSPAQSRPGGFGRLPPNTYGSIRTGSSYTPSSQLGSFVSAPFANSRNWDSRQHSSRSHTDDALRGASSFTENPRLPGRSNPPTTSNSARRRSTRSSDSSDTGESSDGGRIPSPPRRLDKRRALNRDSNLRSRAAGRDDPTQAEVIENDEAAQLVTKVRNDLGANGKAYIFIDHKSLPIPRAESDRERVLADLKDHLKAARIQKVWSLLPIKLKADTPFPS